MILSIFLTAFLLPYKIITEFGYGMFASSESVSLLENVARKFKMLKDCFKDILLFLCALTLSISTWEYLIG